MNLAAEIARLRAENEHRVDVLVVSLRLSIGYLRWKKEMPSMTDLDEMYEDLCELSDLLDVPAIALEEGGQGEEEVIAGSSRA